MRARGLGSAAGAGFGVGTRASAGASAGARAGARAAARVGASMRVRGPARSCDASRGVQLPKHDDEAEQVTDVTGDAKDVHEHDGCVARSRSGRCRSVRARVTRRQRASGVPAATKGCKHTDGLQDWRRVVDAVLITLACCDASRFVYGNHAFTEAPSWRNFSSFDAAIAVSPASRTTRVEWPVRLEARRPLPHGSRP